MQYQSIKKGESVMKRLAILAKENPLEGFWKCYGRIMHTGEIISHKRLHRIYKQINLPLRRKVKKRLSSRVKEPLAMSTAFTQAWSMDLYELYAKQ